MPLNPRQLMIPQQIETERLLLRIPQADDAERVYAAVMESLDTLRQWMPWARAEPSLANLKDRMQWVIEAFHDREELTYYMIRKTDNALVGPVSIHTIDWTVPRMELGYWARTTLHGQGYVTEGVIALTHLGLATLGAVRIEIRCDDDNVRSYRVAERAGYTLEAVLHNHARKPDGGLRDTRIYVRFPPESRS